MKFFWTILFLLIGVPAGAAIRYVDNTAGCPGSGTSGAPWCSIQQALTSMSAGDDVQIRTGTGTYTETAFITGKSGASAGSPNIIEPAPGASFIINNDDTANGSGSIFIQNGNYWTIRNLVFDANGHFPSIQAIHIKCNAGHSSLNCHDILVQGNTVRNWRQTWGPPNYGAIGISLEGCPPDPDVGNCNPPVTVTGIAENNIIHDFDMWGIVPMRTLNAVIRNNDIYNVRCGTPGANGIYSDAIYSMFGNYGMQVYGNSMHDFLPGSSCPFGAAGGYQAAYWSDVCYNDENTSIYNNKIWNMSPGVTGYDPWTTGMFIEANCGNVRVYNNLIYNIGQDGITPSFHSLPASNLTNYFYGNTIYNVGHGFYIKEGRVVLRNNIIKNASQSAICRGGCGGNGNAALSTLDSDYNLFDDGGSQTKIGQLDSGTYNLTNWRIQTGQDQNSATGNPLFVSNGSDFHISVVTSPAVGTAFNLGAPYDIDITGAARTVPWDKGAYKYAVPTGVITITNDRNPGVTVTASGVNPWSSSNFPLKPGINDITVTATDGSGNAGIDQITITSVPTYPGDTTAGSWTWAEGSGSSSADLSGNGNTAAFPNGVTWNGNGIISLNGTNQYAVVADSPSLHFTQGFTLDAWVNPAHVHTDFMSVIAKDGGSNPGPPYRLFATTDVGYCPAGTPSAFVRTNGILGPEFKVCGLSPLPAPGWSHLAVTYSNASALLILYVNGVEVNRTIGSGYIEPGNLSLYIGTSQFNENLDGQLAETRVRPYAIPRTYGGNTTFGSQCNYADQNAQPSIVGDANCRAVQPVPPLNLKVQAGIPWKWAAGAVNRWGQP
jgi:hypothetical protein